MEITEYLRFLFALMFVVGLIAGTAYLARRFGLAPGMATGGTGTTKRLEIVESLGLDPKRRMLLVRRDGREHLILLGLEGETVIETDIEPPARPKPEETITNLPATLETTARTLTPARPHAEDDIFARLRKVADLMQERRAKARATSHAPTEQPRKAAGDRA